MSVIAYSSELNTDQKKLSAIYALKQQFILWARQEGKRLRSNPELKSNWYLYLRRPWALGGNLFLTKLLPVLEEQCRLKESIRKSIYPDDEFMRLAGHQRMLAGDTIFGDRESIVAGIQLSDKLPITCELFDQLKAVDFTTLKGELPPDPTEDLSTFTAVGTGQSVTASTVSIANIETRTQDLYLYIDKGANHFDALNINWDSTFTSGDQNYECWGGACVSNTVNDVVGFASTDMMIFWRAYSTYQTIMLGRGNVVATDSTADMAAGTKYYFLVERAAGNNTITCKIDDNSDFSSLFDTLSVSGFSTTKYRYLYAAVDYNDSASGNRRMTASVSNINLNEAAAGGQPTIKRFGGIPFAKQNRGVW